MKTGTFARPSPWAYCQDRDERSHGERLEEAVERHLANAALRACGFGAAGDTRLEWVAASRRVEAACDSSQAELFRLVEDVAGVDPVRLGKALVS